MIEAVNLTKIYNQGKKHQVEAVKDFSLSIEDGAITALVGPSGCGKNHNHEYDWAATNSH